MSDDAQIVAQDDNGENPNLRLLVGEVQWNQVLTDEDRLNVLSMVWDGLTYAEMGERLGVHGLTVYRWIRKDAALYEATSMLRSVGGKDKAYKYIRDAVEGKIKVHPAFVAMYAKLHGLLLDRQPVIQVQLPVQELRRNIIDATPVDKGLPPGQTPMPPSGPTEAR